MRVVRIESAHGVELALDHSKAAPGRGAWVHVRPGCTTSALSRGRFARSFKSPVVTARLAREFEALTDLTRGTESHVEAG